MKINKIPGIVVLLTPFVLFTLYLGISWWWEWVNCDTRNSIGLLIISKEDKMHNSIGVFVLIYASLTFLIDMTFEKPILSYPLYIIAISLIWIVMQITINLQKFINYINKHLTINLNKDENS